MKTVAAVIVTAILVWHFVVWGTVSEEFDKVISDQCAAGKNCTDKISINPLTDNVTITVSAPPQAPAGMEGLSAGFMVGFKLVAEPLAERKLNKAARSYMDVYAMILPYNATIEEEQKQGSNAENVTHPSVPEKMTQPSVSAPPQTQHNGYTIAGAEIGSVVHIRGVVHNSSYLGTSDHPYTALEDDNGKMIFCAINPINWSRFPQKGEIIQVVGTYFGPMSFSDGSTMEVLTNDCKLER